jgi:ArsR family transcriptional regulator
MEVNLLATNYVKYAQLMKALGDETRVKIFAMLSAGELCACEILEEFQITQPTLSYHMKILSESGLVNSRRDGVWMRYSINRDALETLQQFLKRIDANVEKQSQFVN